jgi:DNA-binding transcriptional ArsR family regulator
MTANARPARRGDSNIILALAPIFCLLAAVRARSMTELDKGLNVTRPTVSQHLKVLREAGLVTHEFVHVT